VIQASQIDGDLGMAVYDVLAPHYDAVTGDSATEGAFVRDVIERRHGAVANLLDVGCGTGGITALLADKYQVSGLDISPGMLAVAREKLPGGTPLYLADMACFKLDVKFDAVVCAYQGVNHLLAFPAWESFFDCVWAHLNDGGVFIFDITTVSNLMMMASAPKIVQQFGDNYLLIRVSAAEEMVFRWQIEVFECQPDSSYGLLTQTVETRSFPVDSIREALRPRFSNIETIGADGRPADEDGADRIWIVCTKPAASLSRTRG
jgi:SAM-dependent methyltransferase